MITTRREFLGGVGATVGRAALAIAFARQLGFAEEWTSRALERLKFGALDPLVDLMQSTPADELMPILVQKLRTGTSLEDLVGAGALANARAFGGTNYNGYHALMAMMPSYNMRELMPAPYAALPVLKVLHRNARFVQETGHANKDELAPLERSEGESASVDLVQAMRNRELDKAEQCLAAAQKLSPAQAYEQIQTVVRDEMNVHRVVLARRVYELAKLTGSDGTLALMRQPVRFCVDEDSHRVSRGQPPSEFVALLPELMAKHGLDKRKRGDRAPEPELVEKWSETVYGPDRTAAAGLVAQALADGYEPTSVCMAMSVAATKLLLHDPGRAAAEPGKPVGSVHGASIGVHASDAANSWRALTRNFSDPLAFASTIACAYHTAGQSRGMSVQPFDHDAEPCSLTEPAKLLAEIEARIRARDQKGACSAARRYCELGHSDDELIMRLLQFAVSEDGALHAEKYFSTVHDEHQGTSTSMRRMHLVALTRVMASQQGFPAPGVEETRKLLAS
jgi:hypothetical protein